MPGLIKLCCSIGVLLTTTGGWLVACSGQEQLAQHAKEQAAWREATFYSADLQQRLAASEVEELFRSGPQFILHFRAGQVTQLLERLALEGYSVEQLNAAFQQLTLRVYSREALQKLQEIDAITMVTLAK